MDLTNESELKRTKLKQRDLRKRELTDIKTVLSTVSGRRLLWRLMGHCRVFSSVIGRNDSQTNYNSGQQDIGHYIMSEIVAADENLYLKMMKENQNGNASN